MFPPREGDLLFDDLLKEADEAQKRHETPTCKVDVFFKFTCVHCGERCTFDQPNTLFMIGICGKCGKSTQIERGGYLLRMLTPPVKEKADTDNTIGIVVDNFKVEKFKVKLNESGYLDYSVLPFPGANSLIKVMVTKDKIPDIAKICAEMEIHFKQSN